MMRPSSKRTYIWLPLWIALGVAIGIFIGNIYSNFNSRRTLYYRGEKLEAILEYINEAYVDSVNIQNLVEDAIPGLIAGLDPHSSYFSAKDMELGNELDGHFSGIGVQFNLRQDTIVVVNIVPGGPSEAAGIMAGDRIVYVDDSIFAGAGITQDKVLRRLRGAKGSRVKLGIKKYDSPEIADIYVTRADIPVTTVDVSFSPVDGIGYIKISKFGSTTYFEFISAISKLKSEGANSFIIDLRQNTGGYLEAAIKMINEFLDKGQLIVYTEGRTSPRYDWYANGTGTCKDDQVVVLIDEVSASASEIFAGAMQDNDRGLVIGRRSYGKGLVQSARKFRDGSELRLTIARYHTPSGRCIQKEYEMGNFDDYSQDLVNRYLRGEFDSQDSIKHENYPLFHTLSGRPVYGNDGVMPDIFIPRDTVGMNSYYVTVWNAGLIYEYAFLYTDMHRNKLNNFETWQELWAYLKRQPLLLNLTSLAENKGIRRRPYYIEESRELFENQLEAFIVRNIFGDEGYYQVILSNDIVLNEAISLIEEGKARPQSVRDLSYEN